MFTLKISSRNIDFFFTWARNLTTSLGQNKKNSITQQTVLFQFEFRSIKLTINDWLIDFNCMPTHLRLFYPKRLRNYIHYLFVFIFCAVISCCFGGYFWGGSFCTYRIRIILKKIYLTHKWDRIGTSTSGQSGPGSNNNNEEALHIPQISRNGALNWHQKNTNVGMTG